jgi:hypothetical protein
VPTVAPSLAGSPATETPPAAAFVVPGNDAAPGGPAVALFPPSGWSNVTPLVIGFVVAGAVLVLIQMRRRSRRSAAASMEAVDRAGTQPRSPTEVPEDGQAARDESATPRWLRASVQAERFAVTHDAPKHGRTVAPPPARAPLVFSDPGADLAERRMVRYDGVQLLDQPSEVYGQTQAEANSGDEVEIIQVEDVWASVVTPSGLTGWLLTMTLTTRPDDVAAEVPADAAAEQAAAGQVADEPVPLEALLDAIVARRRLEPAAAAPKAPKVPKAPKAPKARPARRARSVENPG